MPDGFVRACYVRVQHERGHRGLALPELIVDKAPGPDVLIDPTDGEPLLLLGRPVVVDKRLERKVKRAGKTGKAKGRKGAGKGKKGNRRQASGRV